MTEHKPSLESVQSSGRRAARLSEIALFNIQFSATTPLQDATTELRALSKNYTSYGSVEFSSMAGYTIDNDDLANLRHKNPSLSEAESGVEGYFQGRSTQEIYLDGKKYEIKQNEHGVGLAFMVKQESLDDYRSMLRLVGRADERLEESRYFKSNGVYAKFVASESIDRDIAVLSLRRKINALSEQSAGFLAIAKPKLVVSYT